MLKVCDGARTYDGTNFTPDIADQSITGTVNSAGSVDASNFQEVLFIASCRAVTGSGTLVVAVQESNESSANFTNITNATMAFNAANTAKWISVDMRSGLRKKYLRTQAINTTNAVTIQVHSLRLRPAMANNTLDTSMSQV